MKIWISIYTFDHEVTRIELPQDPNDFTESTYVRIRQSICPRGNTRLYDAVDEAIDYTRNISSSFNKDEQSNSMTFMVIITDGEDNMSAIKQKQIQDKVKLHVSEGTEYIYLGANINAVHSGASIGIKQNACLQFTPDPKHTRSVFNSLGLVLQRSITCEDVGGPRFRPHERQTSCSTEDQLRFGISGNEDGDEESKHTDIDDTSLESKSSPSLGWMYDNIYEPPMPWDTPVKKRPTPNPIIPRLNFKSVLSQTCSKTIDPTVPKTPGGYTPPSLTALRANTADSETPGTSGTPETAVLPRLTRMTNFNGLECRTSTSDDNRNDNDNDNDNGNGNSNSIDINDKRGDIFKDYTFITENGLQQKMCLYCKYEPVPYGGGNLCRDCGEALFWD